MSARRGYKSPISTTDAIIEYDRDGVLGLVLIDRRNPPHGLALPGGFHEHGLTLEENAIKEVLEETNLAFRIANHGRPLTYSAPDRDPRGHMIGHVFYGTGRGVLRAGDDAADARHFPHSAVLRMLERQAKGECIFAFDHAEILVEYYEMRGMR